MKNLRTFNEFVNEGKENPYAISTADAKEFMMAIDKLPDTIKSIKVDTELSMFNPDNKTFKPSDKSWKEKVKAIVKKIVRTNKVIAYELSSYYGASSSNPDKDPYYIGYKKEGSEQFNKDMAAGKYGPLD